MEISDDAVHCICCGTKYTPQQTDTTDDIPDDYGTQPMMSEEIIGVSLLKNEISADSEPTKVKDKIRSWIVSLFIKAIQSCSTEQDKTEIITWLASSREVLSDQSLSLKDKTKALYRLIDSKKTAQIILHSVVETVKNYKNSNLPLALKIAIPITLGVALSVGGQGAGIVAFGGGIGVPVLLLVFLGTAGISSILEAFITSSGSIITSSGKIGIGLIIIILALIAKDEILLRSKKLREAMSDEPVEPKRADVPDEETKLRDCLLNMDPFDFELHIMSFFQNIGMLSWATKKSNDKGIDGFAKHINGLVVVQCKRYASDNPVGTPDVQKWKGAIEDKEADDAVWRAYFVTTSYFTKGAKESAALNDKIVLADMDKLVEWHLNKSFAIN